MQIGRYTVVEEIGSGGFSTVYRVEDTVLGREVALKVMRPLLLSDPTFVRRFKREAQVMAGLDHPHIVPIYDYGEFEDRLCLVMKLMPGRSVGHRVEEGPLPWERVMAITEQVASALDYAHERGLVHRDVKPHNVLLDDEGRAALADFGLVRALEAGTITSSLSGGILGTPAYVPPEIWNAEKATPATDVYALACVVFNMATGATLFDAPTPPATMALHFKAPQYPEEWPEGVPPGVEEVLGEALAREPDGRYGSAGAFVEALAGLEADPLAEPYAALEAAVAEERWQDAVVLGERIIEQEPGYREARALLGAALEGRAAAERASWAAKWREATEVAFAEEEWENALTAAQKWREFAPEDEAAAAAVARAEEAVAPPAETAEEAPPPEPEPAMASSAAAGEAGVAPGPAADDGVGDVPQERGAEEAVAGLSRAALRNLVVGVAFIVLVVAGILILGSGAGEESPEVAVVTLEPVTRQVIMESTAGEGADAGEPTEEPTRTPEPTEVAMVEEEGVPSIYLMGADGLLADTFFGDVGEAGIGMYFSGPLYSGRGAYEELVEKYRAAYGENPIQAFHAHAYDAATMALTAIEQVAVEQDGGSLVIDRQALIEAVYRMEHDGLTGNLACNEFGDCAAPNIGIFRYTDASMRASEVVNNVQRGYAFETPEEGRGVVPEAPTGVELGEVVVPAGAPIELAALQAISGPVANLGTDQVRAVELAFEDFGDIGGHPVQLSMVEDDLCNAEGGERGTERIVANPQILAIIGTSCSAAAVPASEVASGAGCLMISASNTFPALTARGYFSDEGPSRGEEWSYGYFRTAHNDVFQGSASATFAVEELGISRIATINDGDPYTQGLTSAMASTFEGMGGEVVLTTAVGKEWEDMRPVLTEVAASGAELVYLPIFEPAGNFFVLQAEEVGVEVERP